MWRYKTLLLLLFPPLLFYTAWQSIKAFELRYFLQRFGIFFSADIPQGGLWLHAASVGEVNAVLPLLLKIHAHHPELAITISSNTITSAAVLKKPLPENVQHLYFPLDYSWAIKRIINKIKPRALFIVETEFWPTLFTQLNKKQIPFYIINGRISEKTLYAKKWLRNIYATILPLANHVYARSESDLTRFTALGMPEEKMNVLGNIKFSAFDSKNITPVALERDYVLAASTRDDEEQFIVEAWQKSRHGDHLLVIVPRHPYRLNDILKQLQSFNCSIAVRSKKDPVTANTDIYIADTIGELKQFISGSEFVLMGGSFVAKGGHNILEVAQMGKAVIFGPDMRSFKDEEKIFLQYQAGVQCELAALPATLNQFLSDTDYRKTIENNARQLIGENNNVEKYYMALNKHLNE